jgi:lycopene beta-cyclase
MMANPFFASKQILVVDRAPKQENDRTWCFWEKENGFFEQLVHHAWSQLDFISTGYNRRMDIAPYRYKMIRGIDFYTTVQTTAATHSNIHFLYTDIVESKTAGEQAVLLTTAGQFTASYIFNSIQHREPVLQRGEHMLLQHFMGWLIETKEPVFDPGVARFMDFSVDQRHGTTFMYVLPESPTRALVEYTLFTAELLPRAEYEAALAAYITQDLQISNYQIQHQEFGIIPMTSHQFSPANGRVIHIGTVGGQVKASTGYAFRFIQQRTEAIVKSLVQGKDPSHAGLASKRFGLYDAVLLNVLAGNKLPGAAVFTDIFRNNPPARVLRFLENDSNLIQELCIMNSVPRKVFAKAAIQELLS